jgi:hypothetical protein
MTERLRVDPSGRLLVGTSSAAASDAWAKLQVIDSNAANIVVGNSSTSYVAGDAVGLIRFYDNAGSTYGECARITARADVTQSSTNKGSRLEFSTTADGASSPTERMRITSAGMVNIKSDTGYNNGITYDNGATSSKQHFDRILFGASSYYILNNSLVGVRLDNASTSWSTQSDERSKTALQNIENGLDKVAVLRAVTGRYLSDEENVSRSFLIAQDVVKVLPEAVSEDADENKTLGIRYTEVIPLLVAALKESKERIETLEAKVAALEAS